MNDRAQQELALLRTRYPDLELIEAGLWVRIPHYPVPAPLWSIREIEAACQIPEAAGQVPYGFYVRPRLALKSGATIQNYTDGATPFGEGWGKFSWQPATWQPAAEIRAGSNMLDFVASFTVRLREGA